MNIYELLYDEVSENLESAGHSFTYKKNTFLCDVESHPQVFDVSKYEHLCNEDFFQAVFVGVFKRLPESKEIALWRDKYALPQDTFRTDVIKFISNSGVVAINGIRFKENSYYKQRIGLKYKIMGLLYGLTDKSSLREFGKKLPQPIQKVIRKVFL
ncbi:MAG: hypothetical protein IJA29_02475 [Lachnospiraceae bacterium]|nr:hypothetical protein [Lachnospiraceae bacterium]